MKQGLTAFLLILCLWCNAQTDTLFWFAAPEVSIHTANFDRPIIVRLTTSSQAAIVTISQPAGGGMPNQVVNIPANSTQSVDLTTWIDIIENKPPNTVLNYGLKIQSTAPVTAYYEVVSAQCQCNPEIFVLKGQSALGADFWIPSQNYLDNNTGYTPVPYSAFDIVATQNNTTVNITPSNNTVGHAAGVPFTVTLNEGQTFSNTAASTLAAQHLQGSRVISDKPIAITIKDDLLLGSPFGGCSDLGGDQIVPVGLLGTEYIAMKGFLNNPGDQLFITAIQNGTTISQNGAAVTTINAGQTYQLAIGGPSTYIQTSAPVYILQLSGFGCEIGIDILPPIICTGSFDVSFTRSTSEDLFINVLVQNGSQGNFLVNGSNTVLTAGMFAAVPGTGGQWLAAQLSLPVGSYPQGTSINVSNSSSLFHLGLIHGGPGSGTRFGYFSNFARIDVNAQANAANVCVGSGIQLRADTIPLATYVWTGPTGFNSVQQNPFIPSASANNSGNYIVTASVLGCVSQPDTVFVAVTSCFPDTDHDGIMDEYDIDDDNDGITDAVECGSGSLQNLLVNGGFEQPVIGGTAVGYYFESQVPGWETTSTDSTIEIWGNGFNGVPAYAGNQHAEINYTQFSALYQDVPTTPGDILVWYCAHRGRLGVDVMEVRIGDPNGILVPQGQYTTGNTAWAVYSGTYIVPAGQTTSRFAFQAISSTGGSSGVGNFLDDVTFYNVNCYADDDGDGVPNSIDLDSDNDGIYDLVEAGHGMTDANNDGRIDGPNSSFGANGLFNGLETSDNITGDINYVVDNTDGAGNFDFLSINSDGDTCYDVIEAGYATIDGDGLLGSGAPVVDTNGVVMGSGGYATPQSNTANGYDFQNGAYNACQCHIVFNTTVDTAVCQGTVYTLPDNSTVTTTGTYVDTLQTPAGCDSIITTNLTVHPVYSISNFDTICTGTTFPLPGGGIAGLTGVYVDSLLTAFGCDSIITTNLYVTPPPVANVYDTICYHVSYTLPGGGTVNTAGTYSDTLSDFGGCDSIVITHLFVTPPSVTDVYDTVCSHINYTLPGGGVVNNAGNYTDTLTTASGCDSIVITHLFVTPAPVTDVYDSICPNQPYILPLGDTATAGGTYMDTVLTASGCDSIVVIHLFQKPTSATTVNDTICNGTTYTLPDGATASTSGSYPVTLVNQYGCDSVVTTQLTVIKDTLTAQPTDVLCNGGATGRIATSASGGVAPYNYDLLSGSSIISSNTNGNFNGLSAGSYTVNVTDDFGCTAAADTTVNEPAALVISHQATDVHCYGEGNGSINISATGGTAGYTYSLQGQGSNNNGAFGSLLAGTYGYTVNDANGCNDSSSATITEPQAVLINLAPDSVVLNLGQTVQLNASSNYDPTTTYQWTPEIGLSCYTCPNPIVETYNSLVYTVAVTADVNGFDCSAQTRVTVTVIPNYDIFIPNTFTPNGDGNNDLFQLFGNLQALKFVEISIFNRIGEKVFESNDLMFKWDGGYKGKPLPPAVYVYTLKTVFVDNHSEKLFKGTLTLLR